MNRFEIELFEGSDIAPVGFVGDYTPAQVTFDHEAIQKHVKEFVKQFEGIVVDDEHVGDAKKLVAQLRKANKSIDDFRKDHKRVLQAPVKEFEAQCKMIQSEVDAVLDPLVEQLNNHESERKQAKHKKVQGWINEMIENSGLDLSDLPVEFEFKHTWLNKSTSEKTIIEEIALEIERLKDWCVNYKRDLKLIEAQCKIMSNEYGVQLPVATYVDMLDLIDEEFTLDDIFESIERSAEIEASRCGERFFKFMKPDMKGEQFGECWDIDGTEEQLQLLEEFAKHIGVKVVVND